MPTHIKTNYFNSVYTEGDFLKKLHRYWSSQARRNALPCNFLDVVEDSWRKDIDWLFIKYFKDANGYWNWIYGNNNLKQLTDVWEQEYRRKHKI